MGTEDTRALLERAHDGEPEAIEALYARLVPRLLVLIRARMGRSLRARLESRDILQAALLKSFQHLDQLQARDPAALFAWLARIAENEIRDQADFHGRARRDARADTRLETGNDPVATRARSVLSRLIVDEQTARLERALDDLDDTYREVIVLRAIEEQSFRQIGERLHRSEDAARMLYARAMAALTMKVADHDARSGT